MIPHEKHSDTGHAIGLAAFITAFGFTSATDGCDLKSDFHDCRLFAPRSAIAAQIRTILATITPILRELGHYGSRWKGGVMLFVFRTVNFCALGVILLSPFWMFNARLDALLPRADHARADVTASYVGQDDWRARIVPGLSALRREIREDMCRRRAAGICLFGMCLPRLAADPCLPK